MGKYNLWLDDIRTQPAPVDGIHWVWVRSYEEFVETLSIMGPPHAMSLDFDLDEIYDEDEYYEYTGMDALKFVHDFDYWPDEISVHSANPVGLVKLSNFIDDFAPQGVRIMNYRAYYKKKGW